MDDNTTEPKQLKLTSNLQQFFIEECSNIASKQGLKIPEMLSHYLGQMLARFMKSENYLVASQDPYSNKPKKEFPSVVLKWLEGHHHQNFEQLLHMQQVGDIALFTAGFFPERLDRSLVDQDFYMAIGGQAYQRAGQIRESLSQERALNIYFELSSRIDELRELLNELSDQKLLATEKDRLSLYEKWLDQRSPRIKRMLAEVGIITESWTHGSKNQCS